MDHDAVDIDEARSMNWTVGIDRLEWGGNPLQRGDLRPHSQSFATLRLAPRPGLSSSCKRKAKGCGYGNRSVSRASALRQVRATTFAA
jgi:hypothetical protein